MNDLHHLWKDFLVYSALFFDGLHAPRGEELLDGLRDRLELSKQDGLWKSQHFYRHLKWNEFIHAEVELLKKRRETSPSVNDKKYWNLQLIELEIAQVRQIAYCYPRRIYLEISDNCNLRCPMCPQGYEDLPRTSLNIDVIDKLVTLNPYLELVELLGLGEPLMSPIFSDWVNHWPLQPQQTLSITTNGLLLDQEKTDMILNSQVNQIRFSIDAVTPETYQIMRGVNDFNLLMNNLTHFMKRKETSGKKIEVWIRMVVTRANVHELPDFIKLGYQLEVDNVVAMHLSAYTPELWKQSLIFDRPLWNRYYDEAAAVAEKLHIRYQFPDKFELSTLPFAREFKRICREPWDYLYINSEGKVRACCINLSRVGDIYHDSIESIWNGASYRLFRKQLNQTDRLFRCRFCYLNFLYGDVNNVHSHLIDLRAHYREMGEENRLHFPEKPAIEEYINYCLKGEAVLWN